MPDIRLEREGFCQQYKILDVLSKRSKDSLRKTPTLERCAAAPHIEGNYQAFLLQQILLAQQAENDSLQNGWCLDKEGCFNIK